MSNNSSLKRVKALRILSAAVILALCCITPALTATRFVDDDDAHAAIHVVDDNRAECPGASFTTIQSAVEAAAPGDTIQVCPGTYVEQVEITKPLTIVGVSRDGKKAAVVQPSDMTVNADFLGDPLAAVILVRDTAGVTIRNITVDGINNGLVCGPTSPFLAGIFYRNGSGAIEFVAVRNMLTGCALGDGIDVLSSEEGTSRVTVRDSSIHDNDFGGIFSYGPGTNLRAIRNVITGLGPTDLPQFGIQLGGGATGVIEENIVTNHVFAPCSVSPSACRFVSHSISVFETEDVRIVRNIIGKSNTGIFVGNFAVASNGTRVLENRVFDTHVINGGGILISGRGILVGVGENNVVKDNIITNSSRAGVLVVGKNNTIRDNTINEAAIGLLVSPRNRLSDNRFFNTPVTQVVFDPGATLASSQGALGRPAIAPSLLRRGLNR